MSMLTISDYQDAAVSVMKDEPDQKWRMINAALGLPGEVGEVCDHIKKHLFHDQPLDRMYIIKELGDVWWYTVQMCVALDIDLATVAQTNIDKLTKRHKNGFSSAYHDELNRDD